VALTVLVPIVLHAANLQSFGNLADKQSGAWLARRHSFSLRLKAYSNRYPPILRQLPGPWDTTQWV
jgi:hypothetical protein